MSVFRSILIFILLFNALGAKASEALMLVPDSVEDKLIVEMDYSSNSLYAGFAGEERYPFLSPSVYYKRASGLWVSTAAYKLLDENYLVNEVDLSAGYDFRLKKLYCSLNYTRMFFNPASVIVKSSIRNTYEVYVGRYFNSFFASVQADYNTGFTRDLQFRSKVSRYFGTDSLISKHDALGFDPELTLNFGTYNFYEEHLEVITVTGGGKGKGKKGGGAPKSYTNVTYTERTGFKATNLQFNFPLTYSYKNTSLEAACHVVVPFVAGLDPLTYYTLSLYHTFYLKRAVKKKAP